MSIVHPSLTVRLLCAAGWAWYGSNFWHTLHYVDRIEELWLDGIISQEKALQVIPPSVFTYEQALDEEVRQARENIVALGVPLSSDDRE